MDCLIDNAIGWIVEIFGDKKITDFDNRLWIEKKCPQNECPAGSGFEGDKSSTKTLATATDVLLIGGGALVAGGVTWLLLSPSGNSARAGNRSAPRVGAACTGAGCAGSVRFTF